MQAVQSLDRITKGSAGFQGRGIEGVVAIMFTSRPIGFVSSPYKDARQIPKGLGAKHEADGVLKVLPEFEAGLTDIEGFSHLIVIWEFDRAPGFELLGTPPSDNRPHGVFATRSPRRPNPIGLTTVELRHRHGMDLESTCLMGHRSSTSNPTCPASRPKSCGGVGWRRQRGDRSESGQGSIPMPLLDIGAPTRQPGLRHLSPLTFCTPPLVPCFPAWESPYNQAKSAEICVLTREPWIRHWHWRCSHWGWLSAAS